MNVDVGDESAFGLSSDDNNLFLLFNVHCYFWCNKHGDMAQHTETKREKRCSSLLSKWEMMVPLSQGCHNLGFRLDCGPLRTKFKHPCTKQQQHKFTLLVFRGNFIKCDSQ